MTLLYPMAFMVFYTFLIGVLGFVIRANAVRSKKVSLGYFKQLDHAAYSAPEFLVRIGRHYDNQFQLPLLFYVTCLLCMQFRHEGPMIIAAAWLFVLSRMIHSFIHLGSNHVIKRAFAFAAGWLIILFIWVMVLLP